MNELLPLRYRYKLKGLDEGWVNSIKNNSVTYAKLEPGKYKFEVQVRSTYSDWKSSALGQFTFSVAPYFYQETWFIGMMSLLAIGLFYAIDYYRNIQHRNTNKKLSNLVENKTKSLKEAQKRELEQEHKAKQVLTIEVEKRTNELKQQMQLTIEKEKQLRETQKMEVVGQLTSGIAHDFNNMLSIIFIGSDVIRKNLVSQSNNINQTENIKWLDNVLLTAENCRDVIGQLLQFTRKNNDAFETLCVNDALSDIVSLLRVGVPETVSLEMSLVPEDGLINADVGQFNQIILNLIINALVTINTNININTTII